MEKENKIIFGRSKRFSFNKLSTTVYGDAATQLFIYLYFFRATFFLLFLYFCVLFQNIFYHLPIFSQEVDQQNNYMVTGVVPLDSGGEITGRGSGAAGQSWMRIVGNFSGQTQVKKVEVSGSDSEWVTD